MADSTSMSCSVVELKYVWVIRSKKIFISNTHTQVSCTYMWFSLSYCLLWCGMYSKLPYLYISRVTRLMFWEKKSGQTVYNNTCGSSSVVFIFPCCSKSYSIKNKYHREFISKQESLYFTILRSQFCMLLFDVLYVHLVS